MEVISEEWRGEVRDALLLKKKKEIYVPESFNW